jgi:predicted AlkP superfamily pyrophosphatase or phosphodiesterase
MRSWMILVICAYALGAQPARHVILIGVDGLGAKNLSAAKAPRMRELMNRGAWTLHARGVMPTVSSPNWASLIMAAGPEQHGVTSNDWMPDRFEFPPSCSGMANIFPTIFGLLRQQRPAAVIGVFHDWAGFARLVEPAAPTQMVNIKDAARITAAAIGYMRESKPDLLFLHLDLVDHAGHDHGWDSPEYAAAVEQADALIGQVVDTIAAGGLSGRTAILITADHGGNGRKHGGMTMDELEIPWILAGAGVVPGEIKSPVNTFDTAATLARLLGVKPPECWIGRPAAAVR